MSNLEKLQKQLEKDQELIEKLQGKSEQLEAAILQNPDDQRAAMEAAATDKQLQAAYKVRQRSSQAIEAEKERIAQAEKEQAEKQLHELRGKADSIRDDQLAKLMDFYQVYDEWEAVCNRHMSLASNYGIQAPNLIQVDDGQIGMRAIKKHLDQLSTAQKNYGLRLKFAKARAEESAEAKK